jgi:hypothetical protein
MLNYCTQTEKEQGKGIHSRRKSASESEKETPVGIGEKVDLSCFESEDLFAEYSPKAEIKNLVQSSAAGNIQKRFSPDKPELFESQSQTSFRLAIFSESPELLPASVYDRDASGDLIVGTIDQLHSNKRADRVGNGGEPAPGDAVLDCPTVAASDNQDHIKYLLGGIDFSNSLSSVQVFKSPAALPKAKKSSTPQFESPLVSGQKSPALAELCTQLQRDLAFAEQFQDSAFSMMDGENICDKNSNVGDNQKQGAVIQKDFCDTNLNFSAGTLAILDGMVGSQAENVRRKPPPKSQKLSR